MPQREAEEQITARMVWDEIQPGAKQIAHLQGPAPGMEDVTGQDEIAMWNERDPEMTPEKMAQAYIQARNAGLDEEDAIGTLSLLVYRNRGPMLLQVGDDPFEQARYAKKMKQRSGGTAHQVTSEQAAEADHVSGY
jgi:hypothetical protein